MHSFYFVLLVFINYVFTANVIFEVDMSFVNTSDDGVYIVGSGASFMGPEGVVMSDENGDDIWDIELELDPGSYTYKFRNGFCDNWDYCGNMWENIPDECGSQEFGDREIIVYDDDVWAGPFCFSSCDTCPEVVDYYNVTFSVDMQNVSTSDDGVYLVGNDPLLEGPTGHLMSDTDGDDVWEVTLELMPGTYTYKYRNGFCDNWDNCGAFWEDSLDDCSVGEWGDRQIIVTDQDLVSGPFCFNSCVEELCPDDILTYPVSFIVDMNYQETDPSGVYVVGGNIYMEGPIGHLMSDDDGDDIWEVVVDLPPGTYTFKYRNGYCASWNTCLQWQWEDFEGDCGVGEWGDRQVVVSDEGFTYGPYCFDFCNEGECPSIEPIDMTFQVQVSDQELDNALENGVFMGGNFNGYNWYDNALELIYTGQDNIFSVTTQFIANENILYKYTIGNGFFSAQIESNEGVAGCGSNFSSCNQSGENLRQKIIPYISTVFDLDTYDDCPSNALVTIEVDMSNEIISSDGVCIAGGTMPNGAQGTEMCDFDEDSIYTIILSFPYDSYQTYKFVNGCGDTWENPNFENFDDICTDGQWNDRFFNVIEDGQKVGPYYFESCELSQTMNVENSNIVTDYFLYSPYPNPFNPIVKIPYNIKSLSSISIAVYDLNGNKIVDLFNGFKSAGNYEVIWSAENESSGIYFVKMVSDNFHQTQKISLIK